MDLKFGDVQETALIPLAIKASEIARPNARIKDQKAKEIIDALGVDVSKFDPFLSHEGVVARTLMFRDVLKKLIPFLEKHGSHHDAVKNTNATFGWGTKSGKEYLELEPRLKYVFEKSYNDEMKKYSIRGKLFAIVGRNINNRLAVFKW